MLKSIEGYNADRVIELPRHQIGDDRFEVGPLDFGLAVNAAQLAKAVDYEVDGLICAVPHERQGRACFWHTRQLPTQSVREFKHETGNRSCPKVMLRGLQPAGLHPPARLIVILPGGGGVCQSGGASVIDPLAASGVPNDDPFATD
jgi:hypothetical protein